MKKMGTLFLIPTSLSKKVLKDELKESDLDIVKKLSYFVVETPKLARYSLSGLGIVLQELDMRILDEHSKRDSISYLLEPLVQGFDMGLMSDAGVPGIADPGALVVKECHRLGIKVVPLVGPSSITLALMASGLNGQNFVFNGYLPRDPQKRKVKIKRLERDSIRKNTTQIFIEAPYRNKSLFRDILEVCNPNTLLCMAVDITGDRESIQTRSIQEWKDIKNMDILDIPAIYLILGER